jgi:hypothetical protein
MTSGHPGPQGPPRSSLLGQYTKPLRAAGPKIVTFLVFLGDRPAQSSIPINHQKED